MLRYRASISSFCTCINITFSTNFFVTEKRKKSTTKVVLQREGPVNQAVTVRQGFQSSERKTSLVQAQVPDDKNTVVTVSQMDATGKHKREDITLANHNTIPNHMALGHDEVIYEQIEPLLELAETAASMSYNVSHIDHNKLVLTYPGTNKFPAEEASRNQHEAEDTSTSDSIDVDSDVGKSQHYDHDNVTDILKCLQEENTDTNVGVSDVITTVASSDYIMESIQSNQITQDLSPVTEPSNFVISNDMMDTDDVPQEPIQLIKDPSHMIQQADHVTQEPIFLQSGSVIYVLTKKLVNVITR